MSTPLTFTTLLDELEISRVVAPLDVIVGPWRTLIRDHPRLDLLRVCRAAEAWPLAAGLYLGGGRPLIVHSGNDLFEAGDAMRNIVFDLKLPLYALLIPPPRLAHAPPPMDALAAADRTESFVEPILEAWSLDYVLADSFDQLGVVTAHYLQCQQDGITGFALLDETEEVLAS